MFISLLQGAVVLDGVLYGVRGMALFARAIGRVHLVAGIMHEGMDGARGKHVQPLLAPREGAYMGLGGLGNHPRANIAYRLMREIRQACNERIEIIA
jgi:hypothetical protein